MNVLDSVRDCAQNHPISMAVALTVVLPGTYFYITGKSMSCAVGFCEDAPAQSFPPLASNTRGLSLYESQHPQDLHLKLPVSKWVDKPVTAFAIRTVQGTRQHIFVFLTAVGAKLGIDIQRFPDLLDQRWASEFTFSRLLIVAISTALPGAFCVFIRDNPQHWAARHQRNIVNALHVFALVIVANQRISIQDLLVIVFFMGSFEAMQRIMSHDSTSETAPSQAPSAGSVVAKLDTTCPPSTELEDKTNPPNRDISVRKSDDGLGVGLTIIAATKDEEIFRLRNLLTEGRTAEKISDMELRRVQGELKSARETLNETFGEYASLRDEMKSMKQTLGRDHQADVYRKDIELFALRKANEQKENYINDRESKLEDIYRTQKATLELKDAQIRNLEDRVRFLQRQDSPKLVSQHVKVDSATERDPLNERKESPDSQSESAVQVKLLQVKGRSSLDIDNALREKENEIVTLKLDLSKAASAVSALSKTQDELRRAWDATFEARTALNEERENHSETQEKLREAALRIEEEIALRKGSPKARDMEVLPTIEEQDKKELEAMFNTAQEDNLRLYAEVEIFGKRISEANARVFIAEQDAEALREQVRLAKAINEDMESARPSLVHRVHFQRMEGQLKESRDVLEAKENEIAQLKRELKNGVVEKVEKVDGLIKEKVEAIEAHTKAEEENERLRKSVQDLESTKEQLMKDHERFAKQRALVRRRTTSADHIHASARSSGATLTESSSGTPSTETRPTADEEPPLPARPVSLTATLSTSIQGTPERHLRNDTNRFSKVSNDVPPDELRAGRRQSFTLKGLMRKLANKDNDEVKPSKSGKKEKGKGHQKDADATRVTGVEKGLERERERPKTALMPKDKNVLMRPRTAFPASPASSITSASDFSTPQTTIKRKVSGMDNERPTTSAATASAALVPHIGASQSRIGGLSAVTSTAPTPAFKEAGKEQRPKTASAPLTPEKSKGQRPKTARSPSRYYASPGTETTSSASARPRTADASATVNAPLQTGVASRTMGEGKEREKVKKRWSLGSSLGDRNAKKLNKQSAVSQ